MMPEREQVGGRELEDMSYFPTRIQPDDLVSWVYMRKYSALHETL